MRILKSQGSYGYLLPIELGVEEVEGGELFIVGEDIETGEYLTEVFESLEEAEEAFERRLEARRSC